MSRRKYLLNWWVIASIIITSWSWMGTPLAQGAAALTAVEGDGGIKASGTVTPFTPVSIQITEGGKRCYLNQETSDGQGNFAFTVPLPNGTYQVKVQADQLALPVAQVAVTANQSETVPPTPVTSNKAWVSIDGYAGVILPETEITWQGNITVLALLQKMGTNKGITIKIRNGYVSGIGSQNEFDKGPTSGWKYRINGSVPGVGASGMQVKDGDVIEWYYVDADDESLTPVLAENNVTLKVISEHQKLVVSYLQSAQSLSDWGVLALNLVGGLKNSMYQPNVSVLVSGGSNQNEKITDLERRVILAGSLGLIPDINSHHELTKSIYDHEQLTRQGTNGVAFGLLALDAVNAEVPVNAVWTRERMISWLLSEQQADGSWALVRTQAGDVDITAMTLTALAPYRSRKDVQQAIDKAISCLSKMQLSNGGFVNSGVDNSESSSQVILALCSLDISPEDKRFSKEKGNLVEHWLSYQQTDGGFSHLLKQSSDPTASEQALLALVALDRYQQAKPPLFKGLSTTVMPEIADVSLVSNWAKDSLMQAYQQGIIKGTSQNPVRLAPTQSVSRAELLTMLDRLQLPASQAKEAKQFRDVAATDWYHQAIEKAASRGWISGTPQGYCEPLRPVTRLEMALIIVRAYPQLPVVAKEISFSDLNNSYLDGKDAIGRVAASGIMQGAEHRFDPEGKVTREMAATILIRLQEITKTDNK